MATFRSQTSLYAYHISDTLGYNLKEWLNYGLLEMGSYTNIKFNAPTSGYTLLQPVKDDRFSSYRVYEGFGPGWVWESGVSLTVPTDPPFPVSGVYVNNTFYPNGTSGTYAFLIDYDRGRVVFDNTIPSNSVVKCEYTMRDVAVSMVDTHAWKTVVTEYANRYNSIGTLSPSGVASVLKQNRVWLPAVFIDVQDRSHTGLQLGGGELAEISVFYHIYSDRPHMAKTLTDIINDQEAKTLSLFDANTTPFPLDPNGELTTTAKTYPQLSDRTGPYFWRHGFIQKSVGRPVGTYTDLYRGEVRQNILIERYGF